MTAINKGEKPVAIGIYNSAVNEGYLKCTKSVANEFYDVERFVMWARYLQRNLIGLEVALPWQLMHLMLVIGKRDPK